MKMSLKYAPYFPLVWDALQNLPRTGWVERNVKNPESVQEHTLALRELAFELFKEIDDFSFKDQQDILDMLEVHDWPEAVTGDIVVIHSDEKIEKKMREKRRVLEIAAMNDICRKIKPLGDNIFELWQRFEEGEDHIAKFARQIDKYQVVLKAFEYEKRGERVSTAEFLRNSESKIFHPVLVRKMSIIKKALRMSLVLH